nr:MAG TPA: hypothetical protein [Microviridae sp.]
MKTTRLKLEDLRELRDQMYDLMQDSILSESERHIIQTAALVLCDLIKLKKGE